MNYEQIRFSRPDGLVRKKPFQKVTIRQAVTVFLIQILLFFTVESLAQIYLGNGGLAITEAIVLAVAVIPVWILHADPREVFPVRRPNRWATGGALVFLIGAYSLSVIANSLMMMLFPKEFAQIYESTEAASSTFPVDLVVVCLMPAVCEEALHRGLIQSAVQERVHSLVGQSIIMGVFFAFFHVYPIRYPAMFVMGAALSYVYGLTGNLFYSSLMHFSCNLFATLLGYLGQGALTAAAVMPLPGGIRLTVSPEEVSAAMSAGSFGLILLIYGIPAVFFLYLGEYLIRRGTDAIRPYFVPQDRRRQKSVLWNRIYSPIIAIAAVGVLFLVIGIAFGI
jgi:membrane protease YdiL (CAAX protease family)